jgi:t-SNARE complex subunit (syntaxin)
MFQRIKAFIAAFTADHHQVALTALTTVQEDGKVALADVEKAFTTSRAALKAKQSDYWTVLTVAAVALIVGFVLGHKLW